MKRIFASLLLVFTLLFIPMHAFAIDINQICTDPNATNASQSSFCKETNKPGDPVFGQSGILKNVLNLISMLAGVAAVILIMLGGFQYIVAAGDASKISQAKNYILYAIIGLVVTVISQSIIAFVLNKL